MNTFVWLPEPEPSRSPIPHSILEKAYEKFDFLSADFGLLIKEDTFTNSLEQQGIINLKYWKINGCDSKCLQLERFRLARCLQNLGYKVITFSQNDLWLKTAQTLKIRTHRYDFLRENHFLISGDPIQFIYYQYDNNMVILTSEYYFNSKNEEYGDAQNYFRTKLNTSAGIKITIIKHPNFVCPVPIDTLETQTKCTLLTHWTDLVFGIFRTKNNEMPVLIIDSCVGQLCKDQNKSEEYRAFINKSKQYFSHIIEAHSNDQAIQVAGGLDLDECILLPETITHTSKKEIEEKSGRKVILGPRLFHLTHSGTGGYKCNVALIPKEEEQLLISLGKNLHFEKFYVKDELGGYQILEKKEMDKEIKKHWRILKSNSVPLRDFLLNTFSPGLPKSWLLTKTQKLPKMINLFLRKAISPLVIIRRK